MLKYFGAEEMVQLLRALATHAKDPSSVPGIHTCVLQPPVTPALGILHPLLNSEGTTVTCTNTQTGRQVGRQTGTCTHVHTHIPHTKRQLKI